MKKIIFGLSLLMSITGTTESFGSTKKDKSNDKSKNTTTVIHNGSRTNNGKANHCTCHYCLSKNGNKHQNPQVAGGYTQQRKLTTKDKQLFKSTYIGKEKLTPISVSTQVVNGTNYKFICKNKYGKQVTVIIYQSLPHHGGKSKVVSILT